MSSVRNSVPRKGNSTSQSSIAGIITALANEQKTSPDQFGENGDVEHSHLGIQDDDMMQLASDTLQLKQMLVGNDSTIIKMAVNQMWPKVTSMLSSLSIDKRHAQICLLFKLLFFSRAIRCQGNRSRNQFFELFHALRKGFPEESLAVLKLIPHYGCFQDLDKLIVNYKRFGDSKLVDATINVYVQNLAQDFKKIFKVDATKHTVTELLEIVVPMNTGFVDKNPGEVKEYLRTNGISGLSQVFKWVKREGKANSSHRDDIIRRLFPKSVGTNINQARKLMRHSASFANKLLIVVETYMVSNNWGLIDPRFVPSLATTKHRLAFLNKTKSGDTRSTDDGRVSCADTFFKAILDGSINGAQSDMKKLADIIWQKGGFDGCYYGSRRSSESKLTDVERQLINAQWKEMVAFVRKLVEDKYAKDLAERQARIDAGETDIPPIQDPRAVLPVVDTSGSMSSAGVMHYAIAMGIVCASISTIPGMLITFSQTPEVYRFNPDKDDIFTLYRKIMNCNWGMNTNLDATYQLLLGEMKAARARGSDISTDFRLAIFTDGQFDSMVSFGNTDTYGRLLRARLSGFDTFQKRQEKAFTEAGFGVPLVVYWNMAERSVGFPVQSDTCGAILVAGFSQTVMVEAMTGDYSLTIDEATGAVKVKVTPLESFLKTMDDESLDPVAIALEEHWSGVVPPLPSSGESKVSVPAPPETEIAELEAELAAAKVAQLEAKLALAKAKSASH